MRDKVYARIDERRAICDKKYGASSINQGKNHAVWNLALLAEEFGEVAQAVVDGRMDRVQDELVDVGQIVVAWLEALEE